MNDEEHHSEGKKMGFIGSVMMMPLEDFEAAAILNLEKCDMSYLLRTGWIKSSFRVRDYFETETKFYTGWDILEYALRKRLHKKYHKYSGMIADSLANEIARYIDYDFEDFERFEFIDTTDFVYFTLSNTTGILSHKCTDLGSMALDISQEMRDVWNLICFGILNWFAKLKSNRELCVVSEGPDSLIFKARA